MRAIFTLTSFLVTAVATALLPPESYVVEPHLRGANIELDEDRELASTAGGSTSTRLSFSFASALGSKHFCFDYNVTCLEWGYGYTGANASAETSGNAFAIAYSEDYLWLHSMCDAYAVAYAKSCAFTKVDGKIEVDTTVTAVKKKVSLNVTLDTATTTFVMAESQAVAKAYVKVGAKSFTSAAAFCTQVKNMSPFCAGGTAGTDLTQIAVAEADAVGQAFSLASSGALSGGNASVQAEGTGLDYVSGLIVAYAKSWSFAAAGTAAEAFATAFTASSDKSFAEICVSKHVEICGNDEYADQGICTMPPEEACAAAVARGAAYAEALSAACAEAFIQSYAIAETHAFLSANVDCKKKPKLTWTCAIARVGQSCNFHAKKDKNKGNQKNKTKVGN
jgi:hypothetical protein